MYIQCNASMHTNKYVIIVIKQLEPLVTTVVILVCSSWNNVEYKLLLLF